MVNGSPSELLRWIPLLPLAAAVYHGLMLGLVRRETPRWLVIGFSCGSVGAAFLIACWAFGALIRLPEAERLLVDGVYTWFGSGIGAQALDAEIAFSLDPISAVMALVVTGVGFLIHVYSIGYMDDDHREDKGFQRFFCYLNLFTAAMLVLVLADNIVLMFLGWEGVGLCSYLLIGFWYGDRWNAYCGSKAFIVNRIGDFGFLVGIFALFSALSAAGTPTLVFREMAVHMDGIAAATVTLPLFGTVPLVEVVALLLFVGACGKSAQLPLYVWLPDAMAGPTPVSALIHAATMVTAGVYMVCRMNFLYAAAPDASAVVAWVGGLTAAFAATMAITQNDIKKVLAYSTVSQLGYMFLAAGCGGYAAALFHLGTHAFFKGLLFLGAGSVIVAMHHEQDIEKMGGLGSRIWQTNVVFFIATCAISGLPPLSGFFSKDEVLLAAFTSHVPGARVLYDIGVATAALTAFYMFRLYFKTFHGECRAPAAVRDHISESPPVMVNPLWVLAALSALAGFVGLPQVWGDMLGIENSNSLENFLAPALVHGSVHAVDHATEYGLTLLAVGAAGLGVLGAWILYLRAPGLPDRIAASFSGLYRLLVNKYYVDEIYDAVFVRPLVAVSERVLFRGLDQGLVDGAFVNGTARAVRALAADGLKYLQSGFAQGYIFLMIVGTAAIVGYLLR